MYNDILLLLAGLLNVIGTIYAVLSILCLTPKEVFDAVTWGGIGKRDSELITQKEQARLGITWIVTAWIFQCVFTAFDFNSPCCFWLCITSAIIVVLLEVIIVGKINRHFEKEYADYKEKQKH